MLLWSSYLQWSVQGMGPASGASELSRGKRDDDLKSIVAAVTTPTILNDADNFDPDRQLLHHDGGTCIQMVCVLFSSACCFVVLLGLTFSSFALQPH